MLTIEIPVQRETQGMGDHHTLFAYTYFTNYNNVIDKLKNQDKFISKQAAANGTPFSILEWPWAGLLTCQ